jgi:hypothetical protein
LHFTAAPRGGGVGAGVLGRWYLELTNGSGGHPKRHKKIREKSKGKGG